jgi:hypothetical protein
MFLPLILFITTILTLEIIVNQEDKNFLNYSYSMILVLSLFIIILGFELFGFSLVIAYTSVFIVFFLLSFFLPSIGNFKKRPFFLLILLLPLYIFFSNNLTANYNQISDCLNQSSSLGGSYLLTGKFNLVLYTLVLKTFYIETLLLNFFLLFGLILALAIISRYLKSQSGPRLSTNLRLKRVLRRGANFKKFK